jgi:hypothetical protein
MIAIRSLRLTALSLAAAVGLAYSPVLAGPPHQGGNKHGGMSGGFKPSNHPSGGMHKPMGNHVPMGNHKPMGNHVPMDNHKPTGNTYPFPNKLPKGQGGYGGDNHHPNHGGKVVHPQPHTTGKYTPKNGNTGVVPPWLQKPHHDKHVVYSKQYNANYCHQYGVKKSFGYCYTGYNHNHWYCRKWSPVYNCWFFYDPGCYAWYYWCQPDGCYYPCSYLPYQTYTYTPTTVAATGPGVPPGTSPEPVSLPPMPGE